MKVYVAECHTDYEGFSILGVFATEAEAQAACDASRAEHMAGYLSWEIEEFDLQLPDSAKGES